MHKAHISLVAALAVAASVSAARADPYSIQTFNFPGSQSGSRVAGINDVGQILGESYREDFPLEIYVENLATGVVTEPAGAYPLLNNLGPVFGPTGIGSLPADFANYTVAGVNDAGQIVANYRHTSDITSSLLFDPATGALSFFSDPAATSSFGTGSTNAYDINNRGQIVGSIATFISPNQVIDTGFLLDVATTTYTAIDVPGSQYTLAYGINDTGQVVGSYESGDVINGFLFDLATGKYTTLAVPGATSTTAYGINNAGQIVGGFSDSTGFGSGFVATPTAMAAVPEPTSLALLCGGIGMLAWSTARSRPSPSKRNPYSQSECGNLLSRMSKRSHGLRRQLNY